MLTTSAKLRSTLQCYIWMDRISPVNQWEPWTLASTHWRGHSYTASVTETHHSTLTYYQHLQMNFSHPFYATDHNISMIIINMLKWRTLLNKEGIKLNYKMIMQHWVNFNAYIKINYTNIYVTYFTCTSITTSKLQTYRHTFTLTLSQ